MACDAIQLAVPGVRGLHPYQAGKPIEELERELGISESIKLASNENPLGPSQLALDAVQGSLSELTLYPDAMGYRLKQKLSAVYGLSAEQLTASTDAALSFAVVRAVNVPTSVGLDRFEAALVMILPARVPVIVPTSSTKYSTPS